MHFLEMSRFPFGTYNMMITFYLMKLTNWEVNKMNDNRLKGIAVILFGILLSASGEEMNRTVLASFSDFPFALIGIIVGIVGLIMVFKNNKE